MSIYIGTSGWSYDHWQGILYPERTAGPKRLGYYLQRYGTVEVNNTFYRWPREETFASWKEQVPAGFAMTIKAPRGLTHSKKLNEPEVWIERISNGVAQLGDRLAILLVQLPPQWGSNPERLKYFLQQMPDWIKVTVEFRHPTWHTDEIFALLEAHNAAYCIMSGAELPCILRATAPFVYVRFHGPDQHHLYAGSYADEDLRWWADRIREWHAQGLDVYGYFNNDGYGHALRNADTLKSFLAL
jgi:uncharacterized protein YecE (DUF72 family)